MTLNRAFFESAIKSSDGGPGPRRVEGLCSQQPADRYNEIIEQPGIDFKNFLKTRTILFNHDPARPVARCTWMGLKDGTLAYAAEFPEPGVSQDSDLVYGLIKARVLNNTSIGFNPIEFRWDNTIKPPVKRWTKIELCEFSFVAVPAAPGAVITARSAGGFNTQGSDQAKRLAEIRRQPAGPKLTDSSRYGPLRTDAARRRLAEIRARSSKLK